MPYALGMDDSPSVQLSGCIILGNQTFTVTGSVDLEQFAAIIAQFQCWLGC